MLNTIVNSFLILLLRGTGFPGGEVVKNPLPMQGTQEMWVDPWVGKILWSRKWQSTPVFLPGKSHGQRSLAVYSPQGYKESDMTEILSIDRYSPIPSP